jgi:hypothetical protein
MAYQSIMMIISPIRHYITSEVQTASLSNVEQHVCSYLAHKNKYD